MDSSDERNCIEICKQAMALAQRLLALDFETNGVMDRKHRPLPWSNFPVSVAVYAVSASGDVAPLFSSRISGATAFNEWASAHHPFTPQDLQNEPSLAEVIEKLSELLQPNDIICCHNMQYDLDRCLYESCCRLGIPTPSIFNLPRFCTCRSPWAAEVHGDRWLSLAGLCGMYGVKGTRAHTADGDALALAQCLSKAVMSAPGQSLGLGERLRAMLAGEPGEPVSLLSEYLDEQKKAGS